MWDLADSRNSINTCCRWQTQPTASERRSLRGLCVWSSARNGALSAPCSSVLIFYPQKPLWMARWETSELVPALCLRAKPAVQTLRPRAATEAPPPAEQTLTRSPSPGGHCSGSVFPAFRSLCSSDFWTFPFLRLELNHMLQMTFFKFFFKFFHYSWHTRL